MVALSYNCTFFSFTDVLAKAQVIQVVKTRNGELCVYVRKLALLIPEGLYAVDNE